MRLKQGLEAAAAVAEVRPLRVELGERRVVLENHRGVTEYGETLVRVDCGSREVRVRGIGLRLAALSLTEAVIEGAICAVELGQEAKKRC